MKKIFIIIFVLFVLILSGCEKKNYTSINFEDKQFGFLTKFTYDKSLDYTFKNIEVQENEYAQMNMTSKNNNIVIDFEYDEQTKEFFEVNKKSVSDYDNYKEYKYNGYTAYTFSTGDENLYLMIMLDDIVETANPCMYIRFSLLDDTTKTDIMKFYNSDDFQYFINSIEYIVKK